MYMYVRLGVLVFVWGFKRPAKTANQEPISDKSKFDFIFSNVATFFGLLFLRCQLQKHFVFAYRVKTFT